MNVLQTLGIEELCRQPLEVPLSMGGERVASSWARREQNPAAVKSLTQHLVWFIWAAFHPRRVALSRLGRVLRGPGLLGKVPRSPASTASPTC